MISVSLERFSQVFVERKTKLQSLLEVDFLHRHVRDIADTCEELSPKVGDKVKASESLFTQNTVSIELARPGLGLGHDLVWRFLTANDTHLRMQLISGDFAKDVLNYAFSRIETEYASFVGLLDGAHRSTSDFEAKVNGAVLPINDLLASLDSNDSLKLDGKPYEISFERETPIASSPQMTTLTWIEETYRSLSPIYRLVAMPWDSTVAASARKRNPLVTRKAGCIILYTGKREKPRIDQEGQGTCQAKGRRPTDLHSLRLRLSQVLRGARKGFRRSSSHDPRL